VITTAIKKGVARQEWIDGAVRSMTTLNKSASEVIAGRTGVHSMTDVTGFGFVAHAREMALASKVSLRVFSARVPLLDGALECIRDGHIPAGLLANREFAECVVSWGPAVRDEIQTVLFDPQTAGGLLIAVAACDAEGLAAALGAVEVGEVLATGKPLIEVV
jgi:selenide,water dikinase